MEASRENILFKTGRTSSTLQRQRTIFAKLYSYASEKGCKSTSMSDQSSYQEVMGTPLLM